MALFNYAAVDSAGHKKSGSLQADSARQVRQQLRDQGLIPLDVAASRMQGAANAPRFSRFLTRLTSLELAVATRQMETLLNAGLPVEEALLATAQQSERARAKNLFLLVRGRVLEGRSLAQSLAEHPQSFESIYVSAVEAGERAGYLPGILSSLAEYTEGRHRSIQNLTMAMIYPILLFFLSLAVIAGLLGYVVPDMVVVFDRTEQTLPLVTRLLIGASEWVQNWGLVVLLLMASAALGLRLAMRGDAVRLKVDELVLRLPLVRRISRGLHTSRYASTLGVLTSSGVPLAEAMSIAASVVKNRAVQAQLREATRRVTEGASFASALREVPYLPPMMVHMAASGEKSGQLDTMLVRLAQYQSEEFERVTGTLIRLFEPAMLLFMGGLVLLIVLAILLPITQMNQFLV